MSGMEFTWGLFVVFAGLMLLLLLIVLHERASIRRSGLDDVLMRNGSEFDD